MENIHLKLWKKDGVVSYYSDKTRRIFSRLATQNFLKGKILVKYGKKECNLGCVCEFTNEAMVKNKEEARNMLNYFLE